MHMHMHMYVHMHMHTHMHVYMYDLLNRGASVQHNVPPTACVCGNTTGQSAYQTRSHRPL